MLLNDVKESGGKPEKSARALNAHITPPDRDTSAHVSASANARHFVPRTGQSGTSLPRADEKPLPRTLSNGHRSIFGGSLSCIHNASLAHLVYGYGAYWWIHLNDACEIAHFLFIGRIFIAFTILPGQNHTRPQAWLFQAPPISAFWLQRQFARLLDHLRICQDSRLASRLLARSGDRTNNVIAFVLELHAFRQPAAYSFALGTTLQRTVQSKCARTITHSLSNSSN